MSHGALMADAHWLLNADLLPQSTSVKLLASHYYSMTAWCRFGWPAMLPVPALHYGYSVTVGLHAQAVTI